MLEKGRSPDFIDNLLLDAQRWSDFRKGLQTHVSRAESFVQSLKENRYLCDDVGDRDGIEKAINRLSAIIQEMNTQVEAGLRKLDQRTQQMVELVSILAGK